MSSFDNIPETIDGDVARWVEEVLVTLTRATDRGGLKIIMPPDLQRRVLYETIAAVDQMELDRANGFPFR